MGIISGKSVFFTFAASFLIVIFVTGFFLLPWTIDPSLIFMRVFLVLLVLIIIRVYARFIVEIVIDQEHLYIKTWEKDSIFSLIDIDTVKSTYYGSWGIVRLEIKRKGGSKVFFLWAPSFEKERYSLYLEMRGCLENRTWKEGELAVAFVNEKIPEADRNKLEMEKCREVFSFFSEPTRWVADRERDIYLFHLGGGGAERESPTYFGLNVQGEIVIFESVRHGVGDNKVGVVISHKISGLRIPQLLKTRKEEIKHLIREGLDAYGAYGDRTFVISVSVEFV